MAKQLPSYPRSFWQALCDHAGESGIAVLGTCIVITTLVLYFVFGKPSPVTTTKANNEELSKYKRDLDNKYVERIEEMQRQYDEQLEELRRSVESAALPRQQVLPSVPASEGDRIEKRGNEQLESRLAESIDLVQALRAQIGGSPTVIQIKGSSVGLTNLEGTTGRAIERLRASAYTLARVGRIEDARSSFDEIDTLISEMDARQDAMRTKYRALGVRFKTPPIADSLSEKCISDRIGVEIEFQRYAESILK